ncbi:hypothetical protein HDU98_001568, partial [Podochytrium sp. JEL0797]
MLRATGSNRKQVENTLATHLDAATLRAQLAALTTQVPPTATPTPPPATPTTTLGAFDLNSLGQLLASLAASQLASTNATTALLANAGL